jgi:phosphoribosylformylglycinamidine cyclo-ligase
LAGHGFSEVLASRGESAYVVDVGPFYMASIVECLGTKTLVADEMARLTGKSYYDGIAQDTIAMAINDLITVGATPLVVQAYWAAGGSDWFGDATRAQALVAGWKRACELCQVAWGGGETPALAGIVEAGRILNISRYGKKALALLSQSEDHGRTWTPTAPSNLPMTKLAPNSPG